ncbi:MAG: tail fiber domain-containing protein [Phycisphaerales bacterium]
MKTPVLRCLPAAVLALVAGSALAGGNPWLDTGNTPVSTNILGALNNVPINLTSNSQTILQLGYASVTVGPNTYSGGNLTGGYWNNVNNSVAAVCLGGFSFNGADHENRVNDIGCTVLGGGDNSAGVLDGDQTNQIFAFIGGGAQNQARGAYTTVMGGFQNEASGVASTCIGGVRNRPGGDYSVAGGFSSVVRDASTTGDSDGDQGCFIWADRSVTNADFTTTGPNQFLVRAAGGLGVGTNSPTGQIDAAGIGGFTFPQFVVKCTTNDGNNSWSRVAFTNTNTNKFWHFSAKCNGAATSDDQLNYYYQSGSQGRNVMQMRGDGRMSIGGQAPETGITLLVSGTVKCTSLIQTSSGRYKNEVQPLPSVLDRFMQLRPVSFRWDEGHGGEKDMGLIAEEVAAVFPEAVATIDGKIEGINYSRVTALAIQAVKEQQQKVADGQARMSRLEAENTDLRARLERIEKALAR